MEHLCDIKCALITKIYQQINNLDKIDAKEMGEIIDMIKDIEETIYYHVIVEAMTKEENEQ